MRCFHIQADPDDPVNASFARACDERSIGYVPVLAGTLREVLKNPPRRGDLLYCSQSDGPVFQVEALLSRGGVVSLRNTPGVPYFDRPSDKGVGTLLLERKGIPVPRTAYAIDNDRKHQSRSVERIGGVPGRASGKSRERRDRYRQGQPARVVARIGELHALEGRIGPDHAGVRRALVDGQGIVHRQPGSDRHQVVCSPRRVSNQQAGLREDRRRGTADARPRSIDVTTRCSSGVPAGRASKR